MIFLRSVIVEVFGLFVDDGSLAIAILAWIIAAAGLDYANVCPPAYLGFVVFAGLAILLLENVVRRARVG